MEDIKTLQNKLKRAEDRVAEFTQNISAAVWSIQDGSERFEYMSEGALPSLGVGPNEFTDTPNRFAKMILKADRAIVINSLRQLRSGLNVQCEFRVQNNSEPIRMLRMEAIPKLDPGTGKLRFTGSFTDVTILRTMLNSLREAEQRMRAVVDSVGDAIIIIDNNGAIQSLNASAKTIFGYDQQELVGRDLIVLFEPELSERFDSVLLWYDSPNETNELAGRKTITGLRKDGSEFPLEVDLREIQSVNQIHYVAVLQDVSERSAREELLRQSEKNTAISTLAAGVAHEFKNCLAGIMMNASFAQNVADQSERLAEPLDEIIKASEKADKIAKALLSYSGAAQDTEAATNVKEVIESVAKNLNNQLAESNLTLTTELSNLPPVAIVVSDLEQVLISAIVNAIHASKSGESIRIKAQLVQPQSSDAETSVTIQIADNGSGMSREVSQRAFDPFYSNKGVWGDQAAQGIGLGLTIAKNLIETAGGEISLTSRVNNGTVLTIKLNIAKSAHSPMNADSILLHSPR